MSFFDTSINVVSKCNSPLVVLIAPSDNDEEMASLRADVYLQSHIEFSSIIMNNINWETNLSPWPCEKLSKGVGPFGGKADTFIKDLEGEIKSEMSIMGISPSAIYIVGYSLAGLFSLYSLYRSDLFDGAACCSGSLWYPKFTEFVKHNEFMKHPKRIYMSLGDKESSVKNPIFASVENKSREVYEYYKEQGIDVKFEMNPGNHMTDVTGRVSKGISSLLTGW